MAEYIERAQLLKNLGYDEKRRADVRPGSTFDIILKEPAADVAKVWHGRWEEASDGDGIVCSECRTDFCTMIHETEKFRFCPNCGARMGKEAENA